MPLDIRASRILPAFQLLSDIDIDDNHPLYSRLKKLMEKKKLNQSVFDYFSKDVNAGYYHNRRGCSPGYLNEGLQVKKRLAQLREDMARKKAAGEEIKLAEVGNIVKELTQDHLIVLSDFYSGERDAVLGNEKSINRLLEGEMNNWVAPQRIPELARLKEEWDSHRLFASYNSAVLQELFEKVQIAKGALRDYREGVLDLYNHLSRKDQEQHKALFQSMLANLSKYGDQLAELEGQLVASMAVRLRVCEKYNGDLECDDVIAAAYDDMRELAPDKLKPMTRKTESEARLEMLNGRPDSRLPAVLQRGLTPDLAAKFYAQVQEYKMYCQQRHDEDEEKIRRQIAGDNHQEEAIRARRAAAADQMWEKISKLRRFAKPAELEADSLAAGTAESGLAGDSDIWFAINTLESTLHRSCDVFLQDINEAGQLPWFENSVMTRLARARDAFERIRKSDLQRGEKYQKIEKYVNDRLNDLEAKAGLRRREIAGKVSLAVQNEIQSFISGFSGNVIDWDEFDEMNQKIARARKLINNYTGNPADTYIADIDPIPPVLGWLEQMVANDEFNINAFNNLGRALAKFNAGGRIQDNTMSEIMREIQSFKAAGNANPRGLALRVLELVRPARRLGEKELVAVVKQHQKTMEGAQNVPAWLPVVERKLIKKKEEIYRIPDMFVTQAPVKVKYLKDIHAGSWREEFIRQKQDVFVTMHVLGSFLNENLLKPRNLREMNMALSLQTAEFLNEMIEREKKEFNQRFKSTWSRLLHGKSYAMQSDWIKELESKQKSIRVYKESIENTLLGNKASIQEHIMGMSEGAAVLLPDKAEEVRGHIQGIHDAKKRRERLAEFDGMCLAAAASMIGRLFRTGSGGEMKYDAASIQAVVDYCKKYNMHNALMLAVYTDVSNYLEKYNGDNTSYARLMSIIYTGTDDAIVQYTNQRLVHALGNAWQDLNQDDRAFLAANKGNSDVRKMFDTFAGVLVDQHPWNENAASFIEQFGESDTIYNYRVKRLLEVMSLPDRNELRERQVSGLLDALHVAAMQSSVSSDPVAGAGTKAARMLDQAIASLIEAARTSHEWSHLAETMVSRYGTERQAQDLHYHCAAAVLLGTAKSSAAEPWLRERMQELEAKPDKMTEFFGRENLARLYDAMAVNAGEFSRVRVEPISPQQARQALRDINVLQAAPEAAASAIQKAGGTLEPLYRLFNDASFTSGIDRVPLSASAQEHADKLQAQMYLNALHKRLIQQMSVKGVDGLNVAVVQNDVDLLLPARVPSRNYDYAGDPAAYFMHYRLPLLGTCSVYMEEMIKSPDGPKIIPELLESRLFNLKYMDIQAMLDPLKQALSNKNLPGYPQLEKVLVDLQRECAAGRLNESTLDAVNAAVAALRGPAGMKQEEIGAIETAKNGMRALVIFVREAKLMPEQAVKILADSIEYNGRAGKLSDDQALDILLRAGLKMRDPEIMAKPTVRKEYGRMLINAIDALMHSPKMTNDAFFHHVGGTLASEALAVLETAGPRQSSSSMFKPKVDVSDVESALNKLRAFEIMRKVQAYAKIILVNEDPSLLWQVFEKMSEELARKNTVAGKDGNPFRDGYGLMQKNIASDLRINKENDRIKAYGLMFIYSQAMRAMASGSNEDMKQLGNHVALALKDLESSEPTKEYYERQAFGGAPKRYTAALNDMSACMKGSHEETCGRWLRPAAPGLGL